VFGNLPEYSTPEEVALSKIMQEIWAGFAKNPKTGPGWREGIGHFRNTGEIDIESPALLDRNCALFEELYDGRA
jgi:hypothetical protein